ncbi:hypothetical protein GTY67_20210 [Streptomyces sp. SID8374]|uniref:hypothetical protein n=1 Tax=unclassified Streptomyces TaxID=2593676 RepID=UPI00081D8180|nr:MULTISPECIES: hypothetical protein [unclassified Streptomyces]MYR93436.1 hypothetical protein [Streptomyces sp. SID4937]MYX15683.1 hypothetical protein [Streptomyces sp. SID8374]SCD52769.1 hypothetical protein GA0115243_10266 [Streptomyces sp. ScaeMP-e83]
MTMTIKVYAVNGDGVTRVVSPEAEVVPLEHPEETQRFPACECSACLESAQ